MAMMVNRTDVQKYYGKILKTKADLKTSACCSTEAMPGYMKPILSMIDGEIHEKFYGCGSPIPLGLEGCTVLDLGCGTGRDAYVLSKLVGPKGRVIGVDMTEEQIEVARKHQSSMAEKYGYGESNVEFLHGYIEELDRLGIEDGSVDLVVSNCVVNLSFDKAKLLAETFRVLKPGGELYFSDVFTSRRIPAELKDDPVLIGECIAGAYYTEDFRRAMAAVGCPDVRIVSEREIKVHDPKVKEKIGLTSLFSRTVRAFKMPTLEDTAEDYGQVATYLGTVREEPHCFTLDSGHCFEAHRPVTISGNTALMLTESRFARHFKVDGDRSRHFGHFQLSGVGAGKKWEENAEGDATGSGCC